MDNQPRISKLNSWERYKNNIFRVILEALSMLIDESCLEEKEIDLNRRLYFCFVRANHKLRLNHHIPVPEGKNPPDPDDETRTCREDKIPDFYWSFADHTAPDPKRCARYFVLECKRLGKPIKSDWIFNKNYVRHGICRFVTEEHGYGKGDRTGAMIGYVQNMELDDILKEVNEVIQDNSSVISELPKPINGWIYKGISQLQHTLDRSFPITPFLLLHFWVDLRNKKFSRSRVKK